MRDPSWKKFKITGNVRAWKVTITSLTGKQSKPKG